MRDEDVVSPAPSGDPLDGNALTHGTDKVLNRRVADNKAPLLHRKQHGRAVGKILDLVVQTILFSNFWQRCPQCTECTNLNSMCDCVCGEGFEPRADEAPCSYREASSRQSEFTARQFLRHCCPPL